MNNATELSKDQLEWITKMRKIIDRVRPPKQTGMTAGEIVKRIKAKIARFYDEVRG